MSTCVRALLSGVLVTLGAGWPVTPWGATAPVGGPAPVVSDVSDSGMDRAEPSQPMVRTTSLSPEVIVVGATAAQERAVTDTLGLFATANLPLPDLEIEFADSPELCGGHAGRFVPADDGPDRVAICGRMTLFVRHELAHAWARYALTQTDRARLLQNWELDRWRDARDEWSERGTEMAAQTIAFSLGLAEATDDPNMLRFVCSYEALTGEPAPAAVQQSCSDASPRR